jgi:hypothetical protein
MPPVANSSVPFTLALALLSGCAGSRRSSTPPPETAEAPHYYFCQHVRFPLQIDGKIMEEGWERAQWTDLFVDIEGPAKPAPRYSTLVKMMWDQQYLYVGAVMGEPHVRASLTEHDSIVFHDNDLEVFIDPDGNGRDYYEIEVNAFNTIFDLYMPETYIDGGTADHDWNCDGLKSAVHIEGTLNDPSDRDKGWSVEMAIPWSTLAPHANALAPPQPRDVWRINFSRVEWQFRVVNDAYENLPDTPEDNWVWSPQGVIEMHRPEKWGYVEFVRQW